MDCPKCKIPMQERKHKALTDKMLSSPYFFSSWFVCSCGHVQHIESHKVYNKTSYYKQNKFMKYKT